MKRLLSLTLLTAITIGPAAPINSTPARPVPASSPQVPNEPGRTPRHLVTLRGEIVDFYCYIEKGVTGPGHRDCGVKCVAGDICMGLLTTDGDLYMISQDHMRAMDPGGYVGVPNPFDKCKGFIAHAVDLTGFAMERKFQRVVEIRDVVPVPAPATAPSRVGPQPRAR